MATIFSRGAVPTQADFHAAISRRSDRWYAACLRITRNQQLAEDAVQDALLSAWHKREQFKQDAQLETWIHRIAINSALQLVRRQRPGMFTPFEAEYAGVEDTPETSRANDELAQNLDHAYRHLSETERVCFTLKHLEEWRVREIADALETNEGAVKQAVFRAVRKLRVRMTGLECSAS